MTITAAGPRCDICGDYILLDTSINPFRVPGLKNELHCHDKCRTIIDGKDGDWDLPDGPLRKVFEEAGLIQPNTIGDVTP